MSPAPSIAEAVCSDSFLLRRNFCSPRARPHLQKGQTRLVDNPLHQLGQTRSSHQRNHTLLTPDTFVRTVLPGMKKSMAIVHISPAMGASFTEYTAEFEAGGELGTAAAQRFLYVPDGAIRVEAAGKREELGPRGYAFVPEGMAHHVRATAQSWVVVIEKQYHPLETAAAPQLIVSSEDAIASQPLGDDTSLQVKC